MTNKLKKVLDKVERLSDERQNELAALILSELDEKVVPDKSKLAQMAREAWADHQAGRTTPLEFGS